MLLNVFIVLPAKHAHERENHILGCEAKDQTVESLQGWCLVVVAQLLHIFDNPLIDQDFFHFVERHWPLNKIKKHFIKIAAH